MLLHGGIKGVHVDVDDLALWPWGTAINHWFASWLPHALSTRYFF